MFGSWVGTEAGLRYSRREARTSVRFRFGQSSNALVKLGRLAFLFLKAVKSDFRFLQFYLDRSLDTSQYLFL